MGNERHISFEWVSNGVFEMCERYREQALRLVQDAEEESKNEVSDLVIDKIKEDIERIDDLLSKYITRGVNKALNFERPDINNIDSNSVRQITELSEELKSKVMHVLRSHNFEERMNEAPFLIAGVMRCIVDLRAKAEKFKKQTKQEVDFKPLVNNEVKVFPLIQYFRRDIAPKLLKDVVQAIIKDSDLRSIRDLQKHLGLNVSLYTLFDRKSIPDDGEQRDAYIKVWNWTVENILKQSSRKDGLSIRAENAIQRAR
jgi:hypothetical protein